MNKISIVVCTYNPNEITFRRLLDAIKNLDYDKEFFEVIIIDNNSRVSLIHFDYINDFLGLLINIKLIREKKPGLTYARQRGIQEAKNQWILFFDDDNEPASDYLQKCNMAIIGSPQVGIWGPSLVSVEFVGKYGNWINQYKSCFQYRIDNITAHSNLNSWQNCYPYGTGMLIKKEITIKYLENVSINKYTLTDRNGSKLSSGGDVQMVLTGILMGYHAGIYKELRINHMIISEKTNINYVEKLLYGTASAFIIAHKEVFENTFRNFRYVSNLDLFKTLIKEFNLFKKTDSLQFKYRLNAAHNLGKQNAKVLASRQKKPLVLSIYEKIIGF